MKHKTAELTGKLLDLAVIRAGRHAAYEGETPPPWSSNPLLANLILDERKFALVPWRLADGTFMWSAYWGEPYTPAIWFEVPMSPGESQQGSTWMEAVCRAEVASKLGDEVEF